LEVPPGNPYYGQHEKEEKFTSALNSNGKISKLQYYLAAQQKN
jgi:hypothetical protein